MCASHLKAIFPSCETDVDLKNLTTVKTGGRAEIVFRPQTEEELIKSIVFAKQNDLNYFILGEGSNCLASDEGYSGIIIKLTPYFCQIGFDGEYVVADAGAKTAMLSSFCLKYQFSGAEFLASLPASVGGATVMNAGCFGQSMSDIVVAVDAVNQDGKKHFEKEQLCFDYRQSMFLNADYAVTKVYFRFETKPKEYILQKTRDIILAKKSSQPLNKPSFGSVFKRCKLGSVAKLIDDLGFKGFSFNGAKVSEKHAGFFINDKNATTNDFLMLIDIVGQKVLDEYGILLVPEVRYIGDKDDLGRLSYTHNL